MVDADTLIALGAAFKKITSGEIIFREGAECYFYHQLIEGNVRLVNMDNDGNEFIQNIIEPGECFGEIPLFDDKPYATTAIANTDAVIIRFHKTSFLKFLTENPELHLSFSKLLAERLRFKNMLLKELAHHDPEQSIKALLHYFKQNKKNICPECNRINLTRQQIANMTGLRVETVIRTMRHLHEKGLLQIEKGKVYYQ